MEISENLVSLPGSEILFARLASDLLRSGEIDEAQKLCERGLKKFPAYAQAHYILAKCYLRKNMTDEAKAELERVLRYDANHIKAVRDLAGIYLAHDFQDLYKEYLLKLYTLDPLNNAVIDEFTKAGLDEIWLHAPDLQIEDDKNSEPRSVESEQKSPEDLFIDESSDNLGVGDPLFPDKIDLSQFDNLKDDFTTILHGNLDSPTPREPLQPEKVISDDKGDTDVLKNVSKHAEASDSGNADTKQHISQPKEGEEAPIKQSAGAEDSKSGKNIDELNKMVEEMDTDLDDYTDLEGSPASDENHMTVDVDESGTSIDSDQIEEDEEKFEQPKIISQTLGEILVSQKKYIEAKAVFEALKEKQPENISLDVKIAYLDKIIGLEKK